MARFRLPLALLLVVLASAAVRGANHLKRSVLPDGDPAAGWFCTDPDSLYHMRRVDRFLAEGRVDSTDPLLGSSLGDTPRAEGPDGARGTAIPWPPAYTVVAGLFCSPGGAADSAGRRRAVEQTVASLPFWFGIATSLLVALGAAGLAARRRRICGASAATPSPASAALVAGLYHAFAFGSLKYSHLGTGDHHAFVSLLTAALFLCLSRALDRAVPGRDASGEGPGRWSRPGAVASGLGAGAIIGLLLGTWVASLVVLILAQASLAWAMVTARPGRLRHLADFGLTMHLAALLVLGPSLASSPWWDLEPWSVVNLSRFHAAHLCAGTLVCLALGRTLVPPSPARRAALLASPVLALVLLALCTPLGLSIREALAWAGARDAFMASVQESQPLLGAFGASAGAFEASPFGLGLAARHLGWGFLCAPFAWWALRPRPGAGADSSCFVWWLAVPPLLLAAFCQRRFADLALVPLAPVLGLWLPAVLGRWSRQSPMRVLAPILLVLLPLAAHARVAVTTAGRLGRPVPYPETAEAIRERGRRELYTWLRHQASPVVSAAGFSEISGDRRPFEPLTGVEVGAVGSQEGVLVGAGAVDPAADPAADLAPDLARSAFAGAAGSQRVLAQWDLGHAIEWVAGLGTVASNFGAYIGEDAFLAPWRFFLMEDEGLAEAVLEEVDARWVLLTDSFDRNLATAASRTGLDLREADQPTRMWRRLMAGGRGVEGNSISFLRLVHLSPLEHQRLFNSRSRRSSHEVLPAGWIWERVRGAGIRARGEPGEVFRVSLSVHYPAAGHSLEWVGETVLDAGGQATLRVPYATRKGAVARWNLGRAGAPGGRGGRSGELEVPEAAVLGGGVLEIR